MRRYIRLAPFLIITLLLAGCVQATPAFADNLKKGSISEKLQYMDGQTSGFAISRLSDIAGESGRLPSNFGFHGGHESRIVTNKYGTYALSVCGNNIDTDYLTLFYYADNRWESQVLPINRCTISDVHLLMGYDGTVFINFLQTIDSKDYPTIVEYPADTAVREGTVAPKIHKLPETIGSELSYNGAGISRDGKTIYMMINQLQNKPGKVILLTFDTEKRVFGAAQRAETPYRDCYPYLLEAPDGSLSVVAERDVKPGEVGYPAGLGDMAWDALSFRRYPNIRASGEYQGTDPLYFAEQQAAVVLPDGTPNPALKAMASIENYYGGDTYYADDGRLHVVYTEASLDTDYKRINKHVILSQKGEVLARELLSFSDGSAKRMFQTADGTLYIAAIAYGSNTLVLHRADKSGLNFTEVGRFTLNMKGGLSVAYPGFAINSLRGGATYDNFSDLMIGVKLDNGESHWYYCRLWYPE